MNAWADWGLALLLACYAVGLIPSHASADPRSSVSAVDAHDPAAAISATDSARVLVQSTYKGRYKVKPRRFSTADIDTGQFDETTYRGSRLHWRHWGSRKTTGRGRIHPCMGGRYDPCHSYRGRIVLGGLHDFGGCGDIPASYLVYTKARFQRPNGSLTPW